MSFRGFSQKHPIKAIQAGQELILLKTHLSHIPRTVLRDRLAHYVKGTVLERQESAATSSNRARNIGFELVLAAKLSRAGGRVLLPGQGDIELFISHTYNFECKRPQNLDKVETAVRKASRQLAVKAASRPDIGILGLAIGKLVHGGTQVLRSTGDREARKTLCDTVEHFVRANCRIWQSVAGPALHAVLVELSAVIHLEPSNAWLWGSCHIINPVERNRSVEIDEALRELFRTMRIVPQSRRF